jgi:nucleotide-binding universal stress UspA family protein
MAGTALICLSGYRLTDILDSAARLIHPELDWLLLHVTDATPIDEAQAAAAGLLGRSGWQGRVTERLEGAVADLAAEVERETASWLAAHRPGRNDRFMQTIGHLEHEIIRVAEEERVDLLAIGAGLVQPGQHRGPGPVPLSPVARFVTDHARCDVVLLRSHLMVNQ